MELSRISAPLQCVECRNQIDDDGYIPAVERDDEYELETEAALCASCGFGEVGMLGCAPTLDDLETNPENDVLLYVKMTDGEPELISTRR